MRLAQFEQITIPPSRSIVISDLSLETLDPEERNGLTRFVSVQSTADGAGVVLSTRGKRRVGRIGVSRYVLTIPPPVAPDLFATMVSFACSNLLERFGEREALPAEVTSDAGDDAFLQLLAALLVRDAEQITRQHVARAYETRSERIETVRGRILFRESFGHHPIKGVACRYHRLSTDILPNQLILAALIAARRMIRERTWQARASSQLFLWRSLASEVSISPFDFERAERQLHRLTEHYRRPLRIAYAVLFGSTPVDLLAGRRSRIQALEFDMAFLFERLVGRLVARMAAEYGLTVRLQEVARRAIVNARGRTYRRAIPDISVFHQGIGLGVVDTKYKPIYLQRGTDGCPRKGGRVSNSDLYQMFFYQSILRRRNAGGHVPRGAIAVPVLDELQRFPSEEWRRIRWTLGTNAVDQFGIELIPIRLRPVLQAIQEGDMGALSEAVNELRGFVLSLARLPSRALMDS